MFGMSFYEIAIIALVALVILGPEKLPEVARTAGKFLRQARQMSAAFRDTLMFEADQHEQKKKKEDAKRAAASAVAAVAAKGASSTSSLEHDTFEGPLDQLDESLFHHDYPPHDDDPEHETKSVVELHAQQSSDPLVARDIELPAQRLGEAPSDELSAAHLANPFDVELVERHEVALSA